MYDRILLPGNINSVQKSLFTKFLFIKDSVPFTSYFDLSVDIGWVGDVSSTIGQKNVFTSVFMSSLNRTKDNEC